MVLQQSPSTRGYRVQQQIELEERYAVDIRVRCEQPGHV